ncbi:type VI secretion system contractile sheath small subunit [Xanthomonas melonis]|uniref:Type VI secretion system contractile sheath small subunit n=1 Tax=Xanthomonas melonis TaxID=56456 RepID=A0ABS8NSE0_9XANT|nr:type VI secretion system contractile sheath small subunit [Xanthomonas melonis]MCD0257764.1 type VI secretion system contractile sheath small subunit [Xanthomonas melonis]MCD0265982.1 type VI secretion system contractile sheath small subunit [Xanthomonas melonis]MCD0277542.1 type VI secretion system contractile sheath small subunit [Xanthomonas melonis]
MSVRSSSQKFIARNRAPRVQIEYDVEIYGSQKKVQVPFVMGVLSDLSGANNETLPALEARDAVEIDVDNFDARLRAMQPRVALGVPNTLTGTGELPIDLSFERLDDFSPTAFCSTVIQVDVGCKRVCIATLHGMSSLQKVWCSFRQL